MKYYIVYNLDSYFVGYKNKGENEYSQSYVFAKKYKTLGGALNRLGISNNLHDMRKMRDKFDNHPIVLRQKKLNTINNTNHEIIFKGIKPFEYGRIEILNIEGTDIKNLGNINNDVLYEYFKKQYKRLYSKAYGKLYGSAGKEEYELKIEKPTEEEMDDFLVLKTLKCYL